MSDFFRLVKLLLWCLLCAAVTACEQPGTERPQLLAESDTLSVPLREVAFRAKGSSWQATLLTFSQPLPLAIRYTNAGFLLSQEDNKGLLEGSSTICLRSGDSIFYYHCYLINNVPTALIHSDYRSPKTVNPDSNLTHQMILISVDEWRNVVKAHAGPGFFIEAEKPLSGKAGVYYAQEQNPLSAYYVQPGSCTSIPLKATFQMDKSCFNVCAGPLKDRLGNQVADGTLVTFTYWDGYYTTLTEAALLGGVARIEIPSDSVTSYRLFASIGTICSATISLNPL